MNNDARFIELWNDYLEGDLDESGIAELRVLVADDEHLIQMAADSFQTHRLLGLIAEESDSRQDEFVKETLARLPADDDQFVGSVMQHLPQESSRATASRPGRLTKWSFSIATITILVALASSPFFQQPRKETPIAKIIGLSGPLQWTGNGGRVVHELTVGSKLSGGTIDGMSPESWFELEFNDGSTVAISGNSMLTFSDHGQKQLRLKDGSFSASVVPQPESKPMLIHTRSALFEVLGTRFIIDTEFSSTTLTVNEGKVRATRLSDGNSVEVPANHRLIAAVDRDLSPVRVPDSVNQWKSQLNRGPEGTYGKWLPATSNRIASLKAIPFVPRENQSVTLYLLGLPVVQADSSPVIVKPDSRFVVRGRLKKAADLYFGIRMSHPNGEFAGKFRAQQPAATFDNKSSFEAVFRLSDFALDPCVRDRKDELPAKPDDLTLTGVWSFTHTGGPTGLTITEVELIPSIEGGKNRSNSK